MSSKKLNSGAISLTMQLILGGILLIIVIGIGAWLKGLMADNTDKAVVIAKQDTVIVAQDTVIKKDEKSDKVNEATNLEVVKETAVVKKKIDKIKTVTEAKIDKIKADFDAKPITEENVQAKTMMISIERISSVWSAYCVVANADNDNCTAADPPSKDKQKQLNLLTKTASNESKETAL